MLGLGLAIEPQLWSLLFVMVRVGAAFAAAPVFGAIGVPLPVRVALSGAVGVLVLGVHPVTPPAQLFGLATFVSVAAEARPSTAHRPDRDNLCRSDDSAAEMGRAGRGCAIGIRDEHSRTACVGCRSLAEAMSTAMR